MNRLKIAACVAAWIVGLVLMCSEPADEAAASLSFVAVKGLVGFGLIAAATYVMKKQAKKL